MPNYLAAYLDMHIVKIIASVLGTILCSHIACCNDDLHGLFNFLYCRCIDRKSFCLCTIDVRDSTVSEQYHRKGSSWLLFRDVIVSAYWVNSPDRLEDHSVLNFRDHRLQEQIAFINAIPVTVVGSSAMSLVSVLTCKSGRVRG